LVVLTGDGRIPRRLPRLCVGYNAISYISHNDEGESSRGTSCRERKPATESFLATTAVKFTPESGADRLVGPGGAPVTG